jgi:hypothetical protein
VKTRHDVTIRKPQCFVATAPLLLCTLTACIPPYATAPDQTDFAPLSQLTRSPEAIARLYAAPTPGFECIATHPWFAIKPANSTTFERWEVWPTPAPPYGHVRLDRIDPDADVGTGAAWVVAELRGESASAVIDFIRTQSPTYPCRNEYAYFPGPNSNTYVAWVLDNTGWNVPLPPIAIGAQFDPNCPATAQAVP